MSLSTYTSVQAVKNLTEIANMAKSQPDMTANDISICMGISKTSATDMLKHLLDKGVLYRAQLPGSRNAFGWRPTSDFDEQLDLLVFEASEARDVQFAHRSKVNSASARKHAEKDFVPTRREIRKHWVLHMVRDPLVTALFGPANSASEVAA